MEVMMDKTAKCVQYAWFLNHLDRSSFDALYWSLFVLVIILLFAVSGIYQWAMRYGEEHEADGTFSDRVFRRRLKLALALTTWLMLFAGAMVTLEVYALLALQFCVGEDVMSLFWATWTMMQMGSAIAILGIVLALVHILCDIKQPIWALALGSPVLVVAGIGHVATYALGLFLRTAKVKVQDQQRRLSSQASSTKERISSSSFSVKEAVAAAAAGRPTHQHKTMTTVTGCRARNESIARSISFLDVSRAAAPAASSASPASLV